MSGSADQSGASHVQVQCNCGRSFRAEARHAGKHAKCPACGAAIVIPAASDGPEGMLSDRDALAFLSEGPLPRSTPRQPSVSQLIDEQQSTTPWSSLASASPRSSSQQLPDAASRRSRSSASGAAPSGAAPSGAASSSHTRRATSRARSRDRSSPHANWPLIVAFASALVATFYALPAFPLLLSMVFIGVSEDKPDALLFAVVMLLHIVSGPTVLARCILRNVEFLKWGAVILVFVQIVLGLLAFAWFNIGAASWDMDQPGDTGTSVLPLLVIDCIYVFMLLTYVVCAFGLYAIDTKQFEAVLDWYSNTFSKDD